MDRKPAKLVDQLMEDFNLFDQTVRPHAFRGRFEMIGTTRSRVNSFMNKFRKLGFISYNGNIEVHRSLLNAVLQERPQIDEDEKQN